MARRITFAVAVLIIAGLGGLNVLDRRGNLVMAQEADSSNAALSSDVSSSAPDLKTPPPDVAGPWCGEIDDNALGSGTITLSIIQKGSHLGGTWSDDLGGSGKLTGKIKGTAITAKLHFNGSKCRLAVNGILVAPDEVTGNYALFGCKQADGGSFDITSPSC